MTVDETWLYHYDPETKQQSTEWRHSGPPRPKKFRVQKSAGKVLALIFLDQQHPPIDYLTRAKLSTRSITHLCWCNLKDILKEKYHGKVTKGVLFMHDNAPAHLQPRRNWSTWASNVLLTHPILQIWPLQTITCSLG